MKIERPRISKKLEERNFHDIFLDEDLLLEVCIVNNSVFENEIVGRIQIENAIIKNCRFSNTDFGRSDFMDVVFENCDFSNVDLSQSSIHRIEFKGCKFVGTNFPACSFGNVVFEESVINLASFFESKLKKVLFDRVIARNTYFYNCKFNSAVEFQSCNLDESNFYNTSLKGVDISSSTFDSLIISFDELKGCKVSPSQAIYFASLMGLVIQD